MCELMPPDYACVSLIPILAFGVGICLVTVKQIKRFY